MTERKFYITQISLVVLSEGKYDVQRVLDAITDESVGEVIAKTELEEMRKLSGAEMAHELQHWNNEPEAWDLDKEGNDLP